MSADANPLFWPIRLTGPMANGSTQSDWAGPPAGPFALRREWVDQLAYMIYAYKWTKKSDRCNK